VTRWDKGERTVEYLIGQGRLESFEAEDLGVLGKRRDKPAWRRRWKSSTSKG